MTEIKFPSITRFEELFTGFVCRGKPDQLNRREKSYHTRYSISVSGPGYKGYDYGSVELTPLVKEYVENEMMDIRDLGCHFKVIVREDGGVLVTADYDQILGGHWLAMIDKGSIPVIDAA